MSTEFVLLDVHRSPLYSEMELECPICGHWFTVDTETELNMKLIAGDWLAECPDCGHTKDATYLPN
jgi:DNA-directed RNA polymerase subunit RPC12/RpoP